jgi:hypothetical protein
MRDGTSASLVSRELCKAICISQKTVNCRQIGMPDVTPLPHVHRRESVKHHGHIP